MSCAFGTVGTRIRSSERALGYVAVAAFVLLSYVLTVGRYEDFVNRVLPRGDPFTYTVGWFSVLDHAKSAYFATILEGFQGNWYRLLNITIALLSPILTKDPAVLCIANYLIWGLATAAFFRLGLTLGLGAGRAFVVALVLWLWPIDYGFTDYTSVPVLALDAAFTGALLLALANSFVFALNVRSTPNGLIAALSIGIAVWGRGNSAPVVALIVAWPCLLAVWNARKLGDRRAWVNVAVSAILAAAMTIEYYATYWGGLVDYYSLHAKAIARHRWDLHDAMPYLKNIPGFMYWESENSRLTSGLSWASHVVPVLALAAAWFSNVIDVERRPACRQLAIAAAIIYFGTYLANLVLWNDPLFTLRADLLIWRPMLIGLSLSLIVLFLWLTDPLRMEHDTRILLPAGVVCLAWGLVWTAEYTPWNWAIGRPAPRTVERFALTVDEMLAGDRTLGMLWYGGWNFAILQYYELQNDFPEMTLYMDEYWTNIWSQGDYSPANGVAVVEGVKQTFMNADIVVIPEYLNDYQPRPPYGVSHFKDDWAQWLNSSEAPRLRVLMLLQESAKVRLLVVEREELAHGRGDPFRLPYGNQPETPQPDYSNAVIRFH